MGAYKDFILNISQPSNLQCKIRTFKPKLWLPASTTEHLKRKGIGSCWAYETWSCQAVYRSRAMGKPGWQWSKVSGKVYTQSIVVPRWEREMVVLCCKFRSTHWSHCIYVHISHNSKKKNESFGRHMWSITRPAYDLFKHFFGAYIGFACLWPVTLTVLLENHSKRQCYPSRHPGKKCKTHPMRCHD